MTAESGSGDYFIHMEGPASNSWIGLGIGEQMTGALIFVMWADGNGNVTVSPRLGLGNFMPVPYPPASITLLAGSGISDGVMVANFKCESGTNDG